MAQPARRFSLFAQPLDRAAFVAYFLGAVVPLAALAHLARRYVYPGLVGPLATWKLVGLLVSIAALSLGSFLALRRSTRQALARLDLDNRRLAGLLGSSRSLVAASSDREIMRLAAVAAAEVSGAPAAFFLGREAEGVQVLEASGRPAELLYPAHSRTLERAAKTAISTLRPALEQEESSAGGGAALAVPCAPNLPLGGALAIWQPRADHTDASAAQVLSTLAALVTIALRNADLREAQRNFFTHVTNLLVNALDLHLTHQTDHSRRVAHLANQIGSRLGFPEERQQRLYFAALLHDIGMLRIERELVKDLAAVQQHPELGYQMLSQIRLWEDLAPLVRHHHEWYDGSGYPLGLKGDGIPLESRIIAVAETFDSLTSERSYLKPVSAAEALGRIQAASGTQFDPQLVRAFAALQPETQALP